MDLDRRRQLELEAEAEFEFEQEQKARIGGAMTRGAPPPPPQVAEPSLNWRGAAETATGGLANIFNGLMLNYGDEILGAGAGGIDYLANKFSSDGDPNLGISDFVGQRTDQVRDLRNDFKNQDAVAGAFTEIGGSVINPLSFMSKAKNAGKLEQIARATATGATQGGIYGSGEEGSIDDRLQNAKDSALWGGAFGGSLQSILGPGLGYLKDAGGRLQRAAMGLRQSDVAKAAGAVSEGAPNPLIGAFEDLQAEGVFKGSKAPAAVQERIAARNKELNAELDAVLSGSDAKESIIRAAKEGAPPPVPALTDGKVVKATGSSGASPLPSFNSTEAYLKTLKGTDYKTANALYQKEVGNLIDTLDNGGTIADWQKAKVSLQQNSNYGPTTAVESIENRIRTEIASDLRQHIEDQADLLIPDLAGQVKATNSKLSQGHRVNEVLQRSKLQDLAADPEARLRQIMRTSGGYGVAMGLAGAGEYKRSGDITNSIAAGLAGATMMSRGGKYALGSAFRTAAKISPTVLTKAGVPSIVKSIAQENRQATMTPGDFFKAGASGVDAYKQQVGNADEALDILHKEAATSFRDFAAPNGVIDQSKASKWLNNNREALSRLPDLRAQLTKPEIAQRLIERHFSNAEALPQPEVDRNAFKEYVQVEPNAFVSKILQSGNPTHSLRQTVSYLKKDREAVNGLRRAAVEYLTASGPEAYVQNRAVMEKGGLFTTSQMRVADTLYGGAPSTDEDQSTLRALTQMARGGFLSSTPYGQYVEQLEPMLKAVPPEEFKAKLESALYDPLLARDLMNKANGKNVARAIQTLFKDEIAAAFPPAPTPAPPVPVAKQNAVTSSKSFPTPAELLKPPAPGELKNSTFTLPARDAYDSAGKKKVNFLGEEIVGTKEAEALIDADPYYAALYEAESSRNPNAKNPTSSAKGGFQLIDRTAEALGVKNAFDLEESLKGIKKLTSAHAARYGDDPADLYSLHYLGETVYRKWQRGAALTSKQQAQVQHLKEKALPRFMRIYNKQLATKPELA